MMPKRALRLLSRCESGLAVIEFAIVIPVLMILLLATLEFSRYIILHQKLDKAANAMADYATQGTTLCTEQMDEFAGAVDDILAPFEFGGTVIFTSAVFFDNAPPPCTGTEVACIAWQYSPSTISTSRVGQPGGNANIPGNYGALDGQNAIIAEIFYEYAPILPITPTFIGALDRQTIYKIALYKPRLNSLSNPPC